MKITNLFYQHWATSTNPLVELYRYHGTGSGCPGSIVGQNLTLNSVPYEISPSLWTRVGGSASGQSQTIAQPNGFTCGFTYQQNTFSTFDTSTSTYSISNSNNSGEEARHICAGETATFYMNGVGTRLAVGATLSSPQVHVQTIDMDIGWCARLHHGSISTGRWAVGDPIIPVTGSNTSEFGKPFINNASYGYLTGQTAYRTTATFCNPSYLRVEATTMV